MRDTRSEIVAQSARVTNNARSNAPHVQDARIADLDRGEHLLETRLHRCKQRAVGRDRHVEPVCAARAGSFARVERPLERRVFACHDALRGSVDIGNIHLRSVVKDLRNDLNHVAFGQTGDHPHAVTARKEPLHRAGSLQNDAQRVVKRHRTRGYRRGETTTECPATAGAQTSRSSRIRADATPATSRPSCTLTVDASDTTSARARIS